MLATLVEDAPLQDPSLVYEPKYDGIRAVIEVTPPSGVRIWSRLGNDKTSQFPEIVRALAEWARALRVPVVVDGEIVALDRRGEPTGFQNLQGRIHLTGLRDDASITGVRVAFIAFDLLRVGGEDLTTRPLTARRERLEQIFGPARSPLLRLSAWVVGDARQLYRDALDRGWEGLIAKHRDSQYRPGKRSHDWRKIKIVHRQEFVVGGWTDPRASRPCFGALLLGVYDDGGLVYVGHTGSGFDDRELARVWSRIKPLERSQSPFRARPRTNERPHWIEPSVVAEVKFTEWTADDKLRHPIYLGLRDDVDPRRVTREPTPVVHRPAFAAGLPIRSMPRTPAPPDEGQTMPLNAKTIQALLAAVDAIVDRGGNGPLALPGGGSLELTNLNKVFWPAQKLTKGDLIRYYIRVAPALLPAVADRPLVMKRFPNGIRGQTFYQQRAPDSVPAGVRVERLAVDQDVPSRIVGGSLGTLVYMTQIAAISQDPWFSRAGSPEDADHVAIDLDPPEGVSFETVIDVARWVHDELRFLGVEGYPKTSGADGLHVYIPLPPGTPYEAGLIFCQIVATMVAQKHPKEATVERTVRARGRRVYVDYLQNIRGKTLATAYSARASDYAGASAPLTWKELHAGIRREDFTILTLPARLAKVGDLWAKLRQSKGVDLRVVEKYANDQRRAR
jgi:bifunctional non-homologous end joining protein LigD